MTEVGSAQQMLNNTRYPLKHYIRKSKRLVLYSNMVWRRLLTKEKVSLLDNYTVVLSLGSDGVTLQFLVMSNPYEISDESIVNFCAVIPNIIGYEKHGMLLTVYGD